MRLKEFYIVACQRLLWLQGGYAVLAENPVFQDPCDTPGKHIRPGVAYRMS